ncbi:MAG: hypothetical protein OXH77_13775 [Anaerolineaceae bacterium]|nr:hypothetical protein [Anaerolineaceae bacterium]
MRRLAATLVVILAILVYGLSLIEMDVSATADEVAASLLLDFSEERLDRFSSATGPREWSFPADFGPHPDFGTEWWYYTGNLQSDDGRRFGYQFTIFRRALPPDSEAGSSEWRGDQVYMAHFTVTDVAGGRFLHDQRYSRGGAGLAGASSEPRTHIWLEDLDMQALNDESSRMRLRAAMQGASIDFTLEQVKPPRLRGVDGYSRKGVEPHQASYYYSIPRLATRGTLTLDGDSFAVQGESWMDHEFFTQTLTADVVGWDWFALILDDGREMSLGWLRLVDGAERYYGGGGSAAFLVEADGSTRQIAPTDFHVETTGLWTSPHSGATYPAGWRVRVDGESPLQFTLRPLLADQELHYSSVVYWEGAIGIEGDVSGFGYAELTGYHAPLGADFFGNSAP